MQLDYATVDYFKRIITCINGMSLADVKDFLVDELALQIPFDGIVWSTRRDVSLAINLEKVFSRGYQQEQILNYADYRDQDKLMNLCLENMGEAFLLSDAFDSEDNSEIPMVSEFLSRLDIHHCIAIVVDSLSTPFQDLISLQRFQPDNAFTANDKRKLELIVPVITHLLDSRLHYNKSQNWIFDSNQASFEAHYSQSIRQLLENRTWQDAGDFYLVPKRDYIARWEALTNTEKSVVKSMTLGMSNQQIADSQGKSPSTVAKQLTSIYSKLGVTSRTELLSMLTPE